MTTPSVLDFNDFGVDATGANDSTAGLQYALDHAPGELDWGPAGARYRFSNLVQRGTIRHWGRGADQTLWLVQDGAPDSIAFLIEAAPGSHATRSSINGITLTSLNHAGTPGSATGHGLVVRVPLFSMSDSTVTFLGGHGITLDSTNGGDGADEWLLTNLESSYNGGDGIHVHGFDSNVGTATNCRVTYNVGFGISDISLVNTWISTYTSSNGAAGWNIGPASSATLINCSSEDTITGELRNAVVIGGNLMYRAPNSRPLLFMADTPPTEIWGLTYLGATQDSRNLTFALANLATGKAPFRWTSHDHPVGEGHIKFFNPVNNSTFVWSQRVPVVFQPGINTIVGLYSDFTLLPYPGIPDDKIDFSASVEFADADLDGALVTFLGYSRQDTGIGGLIRLRTKWRNEGAAAVNGTIVMRAKHFSG